MFTANYKVGRCLGSVRPASSPDIFRLKALLNSTAFRFKAIWLLVLLLLSGQANAQGKLFSTSLGRTEFFSSTPSEDISAVNNRTQAILNVLTRQIAVRMKISDFAFPNKLMQEHFNENYMESSAYPVATFSGEIDQPLDFSKDGSYEVTVTGSLTMHGVSRTRSIKGKLTVNGKNILIVSSFDVALEDHSIQVPKLVFVKIAQVIAVGINYQLAPK